MFDFKSKSLLGFDDLFNDLDQFTKEMTTDTYPPHNVFVDSKVNPTTYTIELALSGFTKEDITVSFDEDKGRNVLKIESRGRTDRANDDTRFYVVRGIASRAFKKHFTLSKELEVKDVKLENGLLSITMNLLRPAKTASKQLPIN